MNLRRNKNINNDSPKVEKEMEKYSLANINEAETGDEIEAQTSQRSTHSYNEMVQRTTRSIKNTTTKTLSTISSSTITMQQTPRHKTANNKTVAISRHTDQGDGDASNAHNVCKINNSLNASLMQRQQSNLSSVTQSQEEKYENEYEVDDYENECDDNEEDELNKMKECEDNLTDNQTGETDDDEIGDNVSSIDSPIDKTDSSADYKNDYAHEIKKSENYNSSQKTIVKQEISNIRKQITDDFKEREAFLDTFCRQASNGVLRDESAKKHNSTVKERSVPNNRKHKLLAALKAIDDNKSQD